MFMILNILLHVPNYYITKSKMAKQPKKALTGAYFHKGLARSIRVKKAGIIS